MTKFADLPRQAQLKLFEAWLDGNAIQVKLNPGQTWISTDIPFWSRDEEYRIVGKPDSINWDHVAPHYKYMARDQDAHVCVYSEKPQLCQYDWRKGGDFNSVHAFASLSIGTVDWKDSLIKRPA